VIKMECNGVCPFFRGYEWPLGTGKKCAFGSTSDSKECFEEEKRIKKMKELLGDI
jgi:hypothetical protein